VLGKVREAVARFPSAAFFLLWVVALVAAMLLILGRSSPIQAFAWLDHFGAFATAAAGLAALACSWALSDTSRSPSRPALRLAIGLAATLATVALLVVRALLLSRSLVVHEPAAGPGGLGSTSVVLIRGELPSTAQQVRDVVIQPVTWLEAIVVGVVVSGVVSPSAVVRRFGRALVAWRRPRVLVCGVLALVLGALPAAVATIGANHAVSGDASLPIYRGSPLYAVVSFLCVILLGMPLVFAWYGFAAERLQTRVPALVAGLMIGLATSAPSLVASEVVHSHFGFSMSYSVSPVLLVAAATGVALVAVWLNRTARDSLLPSVLLLASIATGRYVTNVWSSASAAWWVWSCVVLGGVVTVGARLWQRNEPADLKPLSPAATSAAPDYEVVVKDLGMPGDWPA
jgi:hypothetical protein